MWHCCHLDFRTLAFRIVTECIFVACSILFYFSAIFFEIGSHELFARAGFQPQFSRSLLPE
jgi:hypothetical protein